MNAWLQDKTTVARMAPERNRTWWSVGVVVDPPFFNDLARLFEVDEQVLVKALVTQAAVEAFHKAVNWHGCRCRTANVCMMG